MIETYRGVVRPTELDHMGHMNVQFHTAKFDEATWHFFAGLGLTNDYFRKSKCGTAAVVQTINYKAEAFAGDLLVCRSELLEAGEKKIRYRHHMFNAATDTLLATSEMLAVHMDHATRKSCPFPDAIRKKCDVMLGG